MRTPDVPVGHRLCQTVTFLYPKCLPCHSQKSLYLLCRWRTLLTGSLQKQYLSKPGLHGLAAKYDNPDQRMVQDASQFCELAASMAAKLAATPFKLAYYSACIPPPSPITVP